MIMCAGHQGSSPAHCCVVSPIPSQSTNNASNQQPVVGVPVMSRDPVCTAPQSGLAGCAHCRDHPPEPFRIYSYEQPRQATAIMHCPSCHRDLPPDVEKVSSRTFTAIHALVACYDHDFMHTRSLQSGAHGALSMPTCAKR